MWRSRCGELYPSIRLNLQKGFIKVGAVLHALEPQIPPKPLQQCPQSRRASPSPASMNWAPRNKERTASAVSGFTACGQTQPRFSDEVVVTILGFLMMGPKTLF